MTSSTHLPLPFLVDRLKIVTNVPLNAEFTLDPEAASLKYTENPLSYTSGYRGSNGETVPYFTLTLLRYGAGKVHAIKKGGRYYAASIEINPSVILYGYNGRTIFKADFTQALSIVVDTLRPMLENAADDVHLVPGIAPQGHEVAYWTLIEMPLNISDPDRLYLKDFRYARHPAIRKPGKFYDGESFSLGTNSSALKVNFYYKDLEQEKLRKKFHCDFSEPIMRVEVTLNCSALSRRFSPTGNTAQIKNHVRLVRFTAADTVHAHQQVMQELTGYCQPSANSPMRAEHKKNKLGGFIAKLTQLTPLSIAELVDLYTDESQQSAGTRSRIRRAAEAHVAANRRDANTSLFLDQFYADQPESSIPVLDDLTSDMRKSPVDQRILNAYSHRQ